MTETDQQVVFSGDPAPQGVVVKYMACLPDIRIVKVKASLNESVAQISAVVNICMSGELFFDDFADLVDGDRIYAEPEGLSILSSGASDEAIQPINGEKVLIATYSGGSLFVFHTIEP